MKLRGRTRRPCAIHLEIDAKQGATIGFIIIMQTARICRFCWCVKCVRPRDGGIKIQRVTRARSSCEGPPGTYLLLKVVSLRRISDIYMTHKGSQSLTLRRITKTIINLTVHKVPKIWTSHKSHGNLQCRFFLSIPSRTTFKTLMLQCLPLQNIN